MSTRHSAALLVVAILWAAGCGPSPVDAPGGDWTGGAPGPPPLFATPDGGVTLRFVDTPAEVPDLTMETLDGRTISMAAQRGKVVLVNFWATWCGPCREEIPFLVRLAERYPDHLTVIGVSEDHGSPDAVAAFGAQYDVNYPLVMSTPEIKRAFPGVFALPTSFVVDPEGRMVESHVGLISPVILEQETRYLASLTHDADDRDRAVQRPDPARQRRAGYRDSRRGPVGADAGAARGGAASGERGGLSLRLLADTGAVPDQRLCLRGQSPAGRPARCRGRRRGVNRRAHASHGRRPAPTRGTRRAGRSSL